MLFFKDGKIQHHELMEQILIGSEYRDVTSHYATSAES